MNDDSFFLYAVVVADGGRGRMVKAVGEERDNNGGARRIVQLGSLKNDEPVDIGFPAIVKVNTGGSSVGVYIVDNMDEMKDAFDQAKKYDGRVVVEQFIKGREFTCGIIDGKALPIVEIAPKEGFYDLSNKYKAGATVEICPAPISKEKTEEIQTITEKVFERLHLRSYARIDFMMDEKENVYCLEVNTLPGMTPTSLLPQEAAAVGMDYPTLCEKLIEVSIS